MSKKTKKFDLGMKVDRVSCYVKGDTVWLKYACNGIVTAKPNGGIKIKATKHAYQRIGNVSLPDIKTRAQQEAIARNKEFDDKMRHGIIPEREKPTLPELADLHLQHYKKHKSDYMNERSRVRAVKAYFGNVLAESVTAVMVEDFIRDKLDEGKAAGTVANYLYTLSSTYNYGIKAEKIQKNPALLVDVKLKPNRRDATITHEQFLAIYEEMKRPRTGARNFEVALQTLVGYYSGMRKGEIQGLTWDRLKLNTSTPHAILREQDTKTRTARKVPLVPEVVEALLDHKGEAGRIGAVFTVKQNNGQFRRVCNAVGVSDDIVFHSLRHTFISNCTYAGIDERYSEAIVGHQSSVHRTYQHYAIEKLYEEALKLSEYLKGQEKVAMTG
jgi:integrase